MINISNIMLIIFPINNLCKNYASPKKKVLDSTVLNFQEQNHKIQQRRSRKQLDERNVTTGNGNQSPARS